MPTVIYGTALDILYFFHIKLLYQGISGTVCLAVFADNVLYGGCVLPRAVYIILAEAFGKISVIMTFTVYKQIVVNVAFSYAAALVGYVFANGVGIFGGYSVYCLRKSESAQEEGVPTAAKMNRDGVFALVYKLRYVKCWYVYTVT